MPPDYLAVLNASYDYEAQSDDEISITEGQLLLLLEKVDDEWWKVKIKAAQETDSPSGLVPAAYVEQAEHSSVVRTLYDYEATAPGELSVAENDVLYVFETEDDWLLVQHSTDPKAGYVPGNYVEVVDENAPPPAAAAAPRIVVPDSPTRPVAPYVDPADRVAQSRATPAPAAADDIKTWAVSEIDKKGKKKKGTLGVGNGNVFFASESDKTPVQKWQTKDLTTVVSEKAKHVRLDIGGASPTTLHFHAGSKDHAEAIIAKLELSKSLASPAITTPLPDSPPPDTGKKASVHFSSASPVIIPEPEQEEEEDQEEEEEQEEQEEEPAPRQTTSYTPPPRAAPPRTVPAPVAAPEPEPADDAEEAALALYDFTADGEDELSVTEGERLAVLEKDGDEWWKCRNAAGAEGVVPASYLETVPGPAPSAPKAKATPSVAPGAAAAAAGAARAAEARRAKADAEAAAEAEAEREKQEAAEAEARKQRARKAEAQEKAKQSALAAEAQRRQRVEAAAVSRAASPPAAQQSSRSKDPRTSSAAGSTNSKTSSEINRPPPEKTRVWHDRSGQFRVEAAFLGFNNGKLRLHKVNGVIVEVPSEKMSLEDMRYVERALEKSARARPGSGVPRISEDDIPLGLGRTSSDATSQAKARPAQQQKKGPTIDWFDFFLSAGCDLDDCTRYAAAFERDKLDEALLADITDSTMRSLGLREGDILRVKKAVARRAPGENLNKPSAHLQEQLLRDEELARQLQAQEGGKAPPHLFADAQGMLKPRRGRPPPKNSVPPSVDIKAIAGASDNMQRTTSPQSTQSPAGGRAGTPVLPARPGSAAAAPLISGFDDDAWTNRPSSTKPIKAVSPPPAATPAPAPAPPPQPTPTVAPAPPAPAPTGPPSLAKTTESDIFEQLAKLSVLRQNTMPAQPPPQQQQQQMQMQQHTPSPAFNMAPPAGYPSGMGMGPSPVPMGHLSPPPMQQQQQQPYNGPRGPFAPVPTNQSLLQPLIPVPTQVTGFSAFVPARAPVNGGGVSPFGSGTMASLAPPSFLSSQPTGFQPQHQPLMGQPTGFNTGFTPSPQPMMSQPTGFNPSAQPMMAQPTGAFGAFGGSPFGNQNQGQNGSGFGAGPLQNQMTGFRPPLNQSMFGPGPASPPPPVPPLPSNPSNNTSPANVFAQMKSGNFANDNDNSSHLSNTGLNGQTPVWGQTYQGYTGY